MLIYNHKQEFVGINEQDLRRLGFKNLAELKQECSDFADLFEKRPSYIHNFKNFNWIYYILHSDIDEAKVIINAKKRSFSATLEIETAYLEDAPSEQAYLITLNKLKALDGKALEEIETQTQGQPEVAFTPPPVVEPKVAQTPEVKYDDIEVPYEEDEFDKDVLPNFEEEEAVELSEPDIFETPASSSAVEDPYDFDYNAPLELEDDIFMSHEDEEINAPQEDKFEFENTSDFEAPLDIEEAPLPAEESKPLPKEKPMLGDYVNIVNNEYIDKLEVSKDYVYDPHVAADELGLPVDLIEEFIGDFIQQSYDFKDNLYEHLADDDLDGVKLLSHKLKGVAANLRIEDAFEVLSIINTSGDAAEIKANLDYFYTLIAKLEGKELPAAAVQPSAEVFEETPEVEDIYTESSAAMDEDTLQEEEPAVPMLQDDLEEQDDLIGMKEDDQEESDEIKELSLADDDIYDVGLKFNEDEPLIVDEDELHIDKHEEESEVPALLDEPEEEPLIATDELDKFDLPDTDELIAFEELDSQDDDYLLQDESAEPKEDIDTSVQTLEPADEPEPLELDQEKSANELGLSKEITGQLFGEFKEQAQAISEQMQESAKAGELQELHHLAMSIKGASDNLRLDKVSKVLERMLNVQTAEEAEQLTVSFKNFINQI